MPNIDNGELAPPPFGASAHEQIPPSERELKLHEASSVLKFLLYSLTNGSLDPNLVSGLQERLDVFAPNEAVARLTEIAEELDDQEKLERYKTIRMAQLTIGHFSEHETPLN
jgi:hypothetical protein